MRDRDAAQQQRREQFRAARRTRAIYRGVVQSVDGDGVAQVMLKGGQGTVTVYPSSLFEFSEQQAVDLTRLDGHGPFQAIGPSPYGGGAGTDFEAP